MTPSTSAIHPFISSMTRNLPLFLVLSSDIEYVLCTVRKIFILIRNLSPYNFNIFLILPSRAKERLLCFKYYIKMCIASSSDAPHSSPFNLYHYQLLCSDALLNSPEEKHHKHGAIHIN